MQKALLRTVCVVALLISLAFTAYSQATRTWVSGVGDDVNPCSRTAPCKTFAGAISKTAASGEINCLDPAGYGAVTITKSITIDCTGTLGGILAAGTTGVIINILAPDAKKTVVLRGLDINGAGTGLNGIRIISAAKVFIEKTVIDGFVENGVSVESSAAVQVSISESNLRNNVKSGVAAASTAATDVALTRCLVAGNGTGISAGSNSTVRLSASYIMHNTVGLSANSGSKIISFRDNAIDGNGTNGTPTATVPLQ